VSLLEIRNLSAGYGKIRVVHGVSLSVDTGAVVALLGRNGAGKSTTLKSIMGIARVFSGEALFRGRDLLRLRTHRRAQLGVGYVPDDRRIFPELTVRENLDIGAKSCNGRQPWTRERVLQVMPFLSDLEKRRGGFLSGGEQQMLTIARTLLGNPEVLLLDEPTEGLAPHYMRLIGDLVLELKSTGMAVLLAEQNLRFVTRLADRVYVLESGEMRLEGTVHEMSEKQEVKTLLAL
jgi:branched-chain amino acid transport system ATP-binding protein